MGICARSLYCWRLTQALDTVLGTEAMVLKNTLSGLAGRLELCILTLAAVLVSVRRRVGEIMVCVGLVNAMAAQEQPIAYIAPVTVWLLPRSYAPRGILTAGCTVPNR